MKYADGTAERIALPAETWILRGQTTIAVGGGHGAIRSATIDPDHVLPDKDRLNNVFIPAVVAAPGT